MHSQNLQAEALAAIGTRSPALTSLVLAEVTFDASPVGQEPQLAHPGLLKLQLQV